MASTKDILSLVSTTRWNGVSKGKARALQTFATRPGTHRPAQRQFFEDVQQIEPARKATYVHPASTAAAISYRRESGTEELTPAELVWLQRLPLDPTQVTHADAARLAGMAGSLTSQTSPSSVQLVQSIWQPVKEVHDRRQAEQQVAIARDSLPSVPNTAAAAVQEALHDEHPDWPEAAVKAEADRMLDAALAERTQAHAFALDLATRQLADLDAQAADRVAITKDVA